MSKIIKQYLKLFENLNIENILASDLYNYMLNKNYSLVNWLHSDLVFVDNVCTD